jgi:hypothetical protein
MPRGDRGARKDYWAPKEAPGELLAKRKKLFAAINQLAIRKGDAWITSVPGAPMVTMDALEGSTLPGQLLAAGYDVIETGVGERLLANATETRSTTNADGTLAPLTEGSTQPVTTIVRHAGIVPTRRFCFGLP